MSLSFALSSRGSNAYIEQTERDPSLLPIEFDLLGITPGRWTPAVVISRHQGLLGNIGQELNYGRAVAAVGADVVKRLSSFGPGEPDLSLDAAIDGALLSDDILGIYNAFRRTIRFRPEDIVVSYRNDSTSYERLASAYPQSPDVLSPADREATGSNNWVIDGSLSQSGYPMMANDPHRAQSSPSLRYMVHLVGPDWNVIGGGEPEIPGISIGHNGHGAWGLTVFGTDGEDLYVYNTNPNNPDQYRYRGRWETMSVIRDTISVRDGRDSIVDLKFTRHGPVVFENLSRNTAYAVRAAWMEVGGSPYLASLRMDQAKTWEEFRDASDYSHIPGENMVWADRAGNIGWQGRRDRAHPAQLEWACSRPGRWTIRMGWLSPNQSETSRYQSTGWCICNRKQQSHSARTIRIDMRLAGSGRIHSDGLGSMKYCAPVADTACVT